MQLKIDIEKNVLGDQKVQVETIRKVLKREHIWIILVYISLSIILLGVPLAIWQNFTIGFKTTLTGGFLFLVFNAINNINKRKNKVWIEYLKKNDLIIYRNEDK